MNYFVCKKSLAKENSELSSKLSLMATRLQRITFLEHENIELRGLLKYSRETKDKLQPVLLVASAIDSFTQEITIDKGERHGVYIGQPVLDANGLLGRVIRIEKEESVVMLLTNSKSAVPIVATRNGFRAIALGIGRADYLELANIPETADIREGDILVTSGLENVFPAGYQIGTVQKIERVKGERFMKILVTPAAHADRSRYMFLVESSSKPSFS